MRTWSFFVITSRRAWSPRLDSPKPGLREGPEVAWTLLLCLSWCRQWGRQGKHPRPQTQELWADMAPCMVQQAFRMLLGTRCPEQVLPNIAACGREEGYQEPGIAWVVVTFWQCSCPQVSDSTEPSLSTLSDSRSSPVSSTSAVARRTCGRILDAPGSGRRLPQTLWLGLCPLHPHLGSMPCPLMHFWLAGLKARGWWPQLPLAGL